MTPSRALVRRCLSVTSVAALAAAALAGCTDIIPEGYPLTSTVRDCMATRRQFIDVWGCVQTRYASGQLGEPDSRLMAFMKLGDGLAGRVSAKELSDVEAKTQLSVGAADLDKNAP